MLRLAVPWYVIILEQKEQSQQRIKTHPLD
jgi:hypothetical protein